MQKQDARLSTLISFHIRQRHEDLMGVYSRLRGNMSRIYLLRNLTRHSKDRGQLDSINTSRILDNACKIHTPRINMTSRNDLMNDAL